MAEDVGTDLRDRPVGEQSTLRRPGRARRNAQATLAVVGRGLASRH